MPNPASKFASWSLVASATILAVSILTAAVQLRTVRTPLAASPQTTPDLPVGSYLLTESELQSTVLNAVGMGWGYHNVGLTLTETTNRA